MLWQNRGWKRLCIIIIIIIIPNAVLWQNRGSEVSMSSAKEAKLLWDEFFTDPSQFWDNRNDKVKIDKKNTSLFSTFVVVHL